MQCDSCGIENEALARFCRKCGATLVKANSDAGMSRRFCPKCGTANSECVAFCGKCGVRFGTNPQAAPPAMSPAPSLAPLPESTRATSEAEVPAPVQAVGYSSKKVAWPPLVAVALVVITVIGGAAYSFMNIGKPMETTKDSIAAALSEPPASTAPALITTAPATVPVMEDMRSVVPSSVTQVVTPDTAWQPHQASATAQRPNDAVSPNAGGANATKGNSMANAPASPPSSRVPQPAAPGSSAEGGREPLPPPSAVQERRSTTNRLASLVRDIELCGQKPFFERVVCVEKAKWKHCDPDLWGRVPQCPSTVNKQE